MKSKVRKVATTVLMVLLFLAPLQASAASIQAKTKTLNDSAGTALSSYSLTSGVAVYSEVINVVDNVGFASLLITEDKAGGAGDVDISVEYSVDGTNWYSAYTSDMSGTIAAEGNVVTALQNVTRWIVHTARLSVVMRYKFDPDADSQITAVAIYQRDR